MRPFVRRLVPLLAVAAAVVAGCDFQPDPVAGPAPLPGTRTVSVRIEYRQPGNCVNADRSNCIDPVFFLGSWMHPNQHEEVILTNVAGSYVWAGTATGVPVNWPPTDQPHLVRVYDPHLKGTATGGVTAARLTLGGQALNQYVAPGTANEAARVYIDDNGIGRNPTD
jgi:hypothetical protein